MYYVASNGNKTAVILPDTDPCNPRDYEHITDMVCFHKRYNLGDPHDYKEPYDFARTLAESYLTPTEVVNYIITHDMPNFKFESEIDNFRILEKTFYPKESWEETGVVVSKETKEVLAGEENLPVLLDHFNTSELLSMVNDSNKCYVSPVYLYDHSGISVSTNSFIGRGIHAEWDSGIVGFIALDKERALDSIRVASGKIAIVAPTEKSSIYNYSISKEDRNLPVNEILLKQGFEKVNPSEILEDIPEGFSKSVFSSDNLYRCGARIFMFDGVFEGFDKESSHVTLHDIALCRDEYVPPSEKDWKKFAKTYVESDVMEYNNYLCGDTYGYQCYEGLNEVGSCWGFNPGYQDIENVMNEELRGWFGSDLNFEVNFYDDFDIEEFLKNKKPALSDIISGAEKKKELNHQSITQSEMNHER